MVCLGAIMAAKMVGYWTTLNHYVALTCQLMKKSIRLVTTPMCSPYGIIRTARKEITIRQDILWAGQALMFYYQPKNKTYFIFRESYL